MGIPFSVSRDRKITLRCLATARDLARLGSKCGHTDVPYDTTSVLINKKILRLPLSLTLLYARARARAKRSVVVWHSSVFYRKFAETAETHDERDEERETRCET